MFDYQNAFQLNSAGLSGPIKDHLNSRASRKEVKIIIIFSFWMITGSEKIEGSREAPLESSRFEGAFFIRTNIC